MGKETFELERFVWATPDRLEIDGRFVGLGEEPPGNRCSCSRVGSGSTACRR